jgi:hypothetical protein
MFTLCRIHRYKCPDLVYWIIPWLPNFICHIPPILSWKVVMEDRSVRGPVDGRSWMWWVINMVWTDSWPSIAGVGCVLICVGAGEEWARKVYALRGLRGVDKQVGSARGTRWLAGSSAGSMVARKARWSRGQEPVQGSGSRPESACGVCSGSPQNRRVTWLSHKTKTGGSAGRDGSMRTERLRSGGHSSGSQGLRRG